MKNKNYISLISSLVLIILWSLLALIVGVPIILPTPLEVVKALFALLSKPESFSNIGSTVIRGLLCFVIVVFSGGFLGILAGRSKILRDSLKPVVTVFKATPVMSIILLAYIWLKTGSVPVFSGFLMAFPVMFVQTLRGFVSMDQRLIQMCDIYNIYGRDRMVHLVIPAVSFAMVTGAKQTLSMIWKVIIAAEVLTLPKSGVGKAIQMAQIQLETADVFAWTLIAIVLTAIGDFVFDFFTERLVERRLHT